MLVCNLTDGLVIMSGHTVNCGGKNETDISELSVTGSSLVNFVRISDANATLTFENVFLNTTAAVMISSSTVRLILHEDSVLSSQRWDSSALGCLFNSNVTLQAVLGGSLTAVGGRDSVGLGGVENSSCTSLTILKGSVSALGAVGLGVGWG
jgi:hypothetical protein